MKPIKVWNDDTKEFVAGGNQRHGDNLYFERPSYEEPFEEVWYNYEDKSSCRRIEKRGKIRWMNYVNISSQ